MGAGGNGNNQWNWESNWNKTRLNRGLGMGMGMNHWQWEGMGLTKTFPLISSVMLSMTKHTKLFMNVSFRYVFSMNISPVDACNKKQMHQFDASDSSETISGVGGLCFLKVVNFFEEKSNCTPEKILATPLTLGDLA